MKMRFLTRPVIALIVFAIPMALYMGILRVFFMREYDQATLASISQGVAATPFQYRVLMPWLIGHVATWLTLPSPTLLIQNYESLMAFLIPLALYAYLFRISKNGWLALAFAMGFFYLYPFLYLYLPLTRFYYASDSAAILLFTLGLFFLHGRQYWQFYVILSIGLFNRETIVFLLLVFAISQYNQMERRPFALHIFAQVVIVVAIKLWLTYLFRNNSGAGMYSLDSNLSQQGLPYTLQSSRLYINAMLFQHWDSFVYMTSFMGFLWLPLFFSWNKINNGFVRNTLWVIPGFIASIFVVGNLHEFRIYGELVPIFLGAVCCIAARTMMCQQNSQMSK